VKRAATVVVIGLCATTNLAGQERQPTIPETLAALGLRPGESSQGVVDKGGSCSIECPSVARTLDNTDVAIVAIVGRPRASYLSDDQRDVYTDYALEQKVVLYQREIVPAALGTPGVVTTLGGTVHVNGVEYTLLHRALPPLPVGATCLFLLKRIGNRYHIADTYYGVFRVSDEGLIPLVDDEEFAKEYKGMPASAAIKEMVARLAAQTRETLSQAVIRTGRALQQMYTTEYSPNLSLAELATKSDLIVRAVVTDKHALLTKDERAIESDYTVQTLESLWARSISKQNEFLVLTAPGGTLTIEGYQVDGIDADMPPFDVGVQYLLFLKLDPATQHYVLPHGGQGAFAIRGEPGRESVYQLSSKFGALGFSKEWNGPPPLSVFIENLRSALHK
jgi:hypothetical protein